MNKSAVSAKNYMLRYFTFQLKHTAITQQLTLYIQEVRLKTHTSFVTKKRYCITKLVKH